MEVTKMPDKKTETQNENTMAEGKMKIGARIRTSHFGKGRWTARRVGSLVTAAALFLSIAPISSAASVGDPVMDWNEIALAATVTAGQGAVPQIRSMAIVQVSVHDAVNGITGEYETYLSTGPAPDGASPDAAAIAAAHFALVARLPSQSATLNAAKDASLDAEGLTEDDPGFAWGESIAEAILSERSTDGAAQASFAYTAPGAGDPGVWVAIGTTPALLPGWGSVAPWVLNSGSQFMPDGPPALDSGRYARDYDEIKAIGSKTGSTRTSEQTEIARFWLASPGVLWNGVARQVIAARDLSSSDAARTFALLYLAGADASIVCWEAKYTFNYWRPMAAIRSGDLDGNDDTVVDAAWEPLFPTPPHPEYLSGHTTNSSAMASTLEFLFGDDPDVSIVGVSPTNPGFTRHWTKFSEGVDEVIEARIWSGIHFRTSDETGARVGRKVARFTIKHALR
jgi:hypothetical protein